METVLKSKRDLEQELRSKAERFSNEFNFIGLDVVKTYLEANDECLTDCIRHEDPERIDFINDYSHYDEYLEYVMDCEECEKEVADKYIEEGEDANDYEKDFIDSNHLTDDWYEFVRSKQDDNYPMWSTLFEFKHNPSEDVLQAAIDSGFGVIESDHFNPMLFVAGAGYSFMAQHWIPMYLRLPWVNASKFEGVKYSHL